jgi:hypothetical protein
LLAHHDELIGRMVRAFTRDDFDFEPLAEVRPLFEALDTLDE